MPTFGITPGIPSYPVDLSDEDASLVLPLYRAVSVLAQNVSVATGNVTYTQAEQSQADQFSKLISHRANKLMVKATAALGFGKLVTLSLSGGKVVAGLADATDGTKPAHGIVDKIDGIASGEWGEIIFMQGRSTGISGTSFMTRYYLSTAGQVQTAAPTASGSLVQIVGLGLGSAGFWSDMSLHYFTNP